MAIGHKNEDKEPGLQKAKDRHRSVTAELLKQTYKRDKIFILMAHSEWQWMDHLYGEELYQICLSIKGTQEGSADTKSHHVLGHSQRKQKDKGPNPQEPT